MQKECTERIFVDVAVHNPDPSLQTVFPDISFRQSSGFPVQLNTRKELYFRDHTHNERNHRVIGSEISCPDMPVPGRKIRQQYRVRSVTEIIGILRQPDAAETGIVNSQTHGSFLFQVIHVHPGIG